MLKPRDNKKGFTIIEVVLVLAIAGLIFMAVFIALPALQRAQRDTRRKEDINRFIAQIQTYQSNNRSRLPGENSDGTIESTGSIEGHVKKEDGVKSGTWKYFYDNYLLSEDKDDFSDPNGDPYGIKIVNDDSGLPTTFKDQYAEGRHILVHLGYQCDGENVSKATGGKRKIAVRYRGESGSVICQNN